MINVLSQTNNCINTFISPSSSLPFSLTWWHRSPLFSPLFPSIKYCMQTTPQHFCIDHRCLTLDVDRIVPITVAITIRWRRRGGQWWCSSGGRSGSAITCTIIFLRHVDGSNGKRNRLNQIMNDQQMFGMIDWSIGRSIGTTMNERMKDWRSETIIRTNDDDRTKKNRKRHGYSRI